MKIALNLFALALVLSFAFSARAGEPAAKGNDKAPLGSPDYYPSPEHPVGWRGDGTGRYIAATPPTTWSRNEKGEKKNIVWETKLPCYSWSTPIIIGNRIITRSEPYDLICLDKNTGKVLWIRSHPPLIAISDEEKKANPAFKDADSTFEQLQQVNDEFVAKGWSQELYKKKYDLQKKLNDQLVAIDKKYKLPPDMYVESWSGYTGSTPCSDGKYICFVSGDGVTACYDLDGNKKWTSYEQISAASWGEHGSGWSPAIVGNKLLLQSRAVDVATGAEIVKFAYKKTTDQWATLPFKVGGTDYALAYGNIIRLSDGKAVCDPPITFTSSVPVINDNVFYIPGSLWTFWFKVDAQGGGDPKAVILNPQNAAGYQHLALPIEDEKTRWDPVNFIASSPLYDNGILYMVNVKGKIYAVDVKENKVLYFLAKPPFDFKNPASRKTFGMGLGASITLAGKYIYILDSAGCMIVMEPGKEYKQVAKNNIDETVPTAWEEKHWMGAHHEQTEASPVFEGGRIYIRGEQYLYCVGEK